MINWWHGANLLQDAFMLMTPKHLNPFGLSMPHMASFASNHIHNAWRAITGVILIKLFFIHPLISSFISWMSFKMFIH